jgi:hypothetical protein
MYHVLREGITGGLSIVHNRCNIKGITFIKKLFYNERENKIEVCPSDILSHCLCIDGNSLYPSAFSSLQDRDKIPWHDGIMYMPGVLKFNSSNKNAALHVIGERKELFFALVKGHISPKNYNRPTPGACSRYANVLNFPPIFMRLRLTSEGETIGDTMYNYMQNAGIKTDVREEKLTQLLDTNGEYIVISCYRLWFLLDFCYFEIDDVKEIYVFEKNRAFNPFVTEFMNKRIETNDEAASSFYKTALNGSYGYDGMNQEHYTKSKILTHDELRLKQLRPNFTSSKKLFSGGQEKYQVEWLPKFYGCDTFFVEAFFTLDNAKTLYLLFIYTFMYRCLNMDRLHFIEGDTDSMFWGIAGNLSEPRTQAFKYVIKYPEFYNNNVFKWLPADFYCTDESKIPKFSTKLEQKKFKKRLGCFAIEKESDCVIALCPKVYIPFNRDKSSVPGGKATAKGVNLSQNKLVESDYLKVFYEGIRNVGKRVITGANTNFQLHEGIMSKVTVHKNILTAAYTKYKVLDDFSTCVPLFYGAREGI